MIELVILIQSLYFIHQEKYSYVYLFIALSYIFMFFSENILVYLWISVFIVFIVYLLFDSRINESFKRRRRRRGRKSIKKLKKKAQQAKKQTKKQVNVAKKQTVKQVNVAKKQAKKQVKVAKKQAKKQIKNLKNKTGLSTDRTKEQEPEEDLNNMETGYNYSKEEEVLINKEFPNEL